MRALGILQATGLLLVGILIAEVALWSHWAKQDIVLGILTSALVAYAGLLSWVFLGDRDAWPRKLFVWMWQRLFSTTYRAILSCFVLIIAAVSFCILLIQAWPTRLTGNIAFNQRPVTEPVTVTVLTGISEPIVHITDKSRFSLELPRSLSDSTLAITAESKNFRTDGTIHTKPENVFVELVRRKRLIVRLRNSENSQFKYNDIQVTAHEAAQDAQPIPAITDESGVAFFEAQKDSTWRISIATDRVYTSSLFRVEKLPHTFEADLAEKEKWTIDQLSTPNMRRSVTLRSEILPLAYVKAISSTGRPVRPEESKGIDPVLVSWSPRASLLLVRSGYMLSFNEAFKIPNWTAYALSGSAIDSGRPDRFQADPDLPKSVTAANEDYRGSGYDRGNLVSFYDMRYKSKQAVAEAAYLSSIAPQTPRLNQIVWYKIENFGREIAERFGKVYIFAGPAFIPRDGSEDRISISFIGDGKIAIPTHFFRIHVAEINGTLKAISFLVPNETGMDREAERYLVSINRIEAVTGLTFFSTLAEPVRNSLKTESQTDLWK